MVHTTGIITGAAVYCVGCGGGNSCWLGSWLGLFCRKPIWTELGDDVLDGGIEVFQVVSTDTKKSWKVSKKQAMISRRKRRSHLIGSLICLARQSCLVCLARLSCLNWRWSRMVCCKIWEEDFTNNSKKCNGERRPRLQSYWASDSSLLKI